MMKMTWFDASTYAYENKIVQIVQFRKLPLSQWEVHHFLPFSEANLPYRNSVDRIRFRNSVYL